MGKKIEQAVKDREAKALSDLFHERKISNYAEFARDYDVPGGKSMVKQHLDALRPISMDAALAYVNGLNCELRRLSPRLADAVKAQAHLSDGNAETDISLSNSEKKLIAAFRSADDHGRAALLWVADQCLAQKAKPSIAEQVAAIDPATLASSEEVREKADAGRTL